MVNKVNHAYLELVRYIPPVDAQIRSTVVVSAFDFNGKDIRDYDLCEELHYSPYNNNRCEVVFVWRKRKNG